MKKLLSLLLVLPMFFVVVAPLSAKTVYGTRQCPAGTTEKVVFWFIKQCVPVKEETPTQSPTPTVTPTQIEEEPTVTPTEEPQAPVTAPVIATQSGFTPAGAPGCGGAKPGAIPSSSAKRLGNAVTVFYWPTVIGGQVNIRYREVGKTAWEHALRDYPNLGVAPIGSLKEGVKYEYQIANGHGCAQSDWSKVFQAF